MRVRRRCRGATWAQTTDDDLDNVFASYGWWFGNVRCHPDNPDNVFVIGDQAHADFVCAVAMIKLLENLVLTIVLLII